MKYFTIIQARTNSKRLPAKCLLPVANIPLAVLCAKRVKSSRSTCFIVTSNDKSDDLLSLYLDHSKISYFRGDLNNVLNRYIQLSLKLKIKPEDTIIRLTADNPLVDNIFLEKMMKIWERYKLDYLSAEPDNLKEYGWPKGLSAEFFKAESLLEIKYSDADIFSQEHVTPLIKKNAKKTAHMAEFENLGFLFKRSYGVDTLEDYLFISSLFQKVDWNESYFNILDIEKKGYLHD